jgi:hypothetical protein
MEPFFYSLTAKTGFLFNFEAKENPANKIIAPTIAKNLL